MTRPVFRQCDVTDNACNEGGLHEFKMNVPVYFYISSY